MIIQKINHQASEFKHYSVGEKEYRPWGHYEVLNAGIQNGEEFCEKTIEMKPRQAMSLQRHKLRREFWRVEEGKLTVILNGGFYTLSAGDTTDIPLQAIHCMVNLSDKKVVIYEKQMGICREADNDRLADISGRDVVDISSFEVEAVASKAIYERLTKLISS